MLYKGLACARPTQANKLGIHDVEKVFHENILFVASKWKRFEDGEGRLDMDMRQEAFLPFSKLEPVLSATDHKLRGWLEQSDMCEKTEDTLWWTV